MPGDVISLHLPGRYQPLHCHVFRLQDGREGGQSDRAGVDGELPAHHVVGDRVQQEGEHLARVHVLQSVRLPLSPFTLLPPLRLVRAVLPPQQELSVEQVSSDWKLRLEAVADSIDLDLVAGPGEQFSDRH